MLRDSCQCKDYSIGLCYVNKKKLSQKGLTTEEKTVVRQWPMTMMMCTDFKVYQRNS